MSTDTLPFTRRATADEIHRYGSGYGPRVVGAVETERGLMVESSRPWRYAATLWGGHSYAWGDEPEYFHSLAEILAEYEDRARGWSTYFPTWGDCSAECGEPGERVTVGLVYRLADDDPALADPAGFSGGYPSAVLTMGRRGGLRWGDA